MGKKKRGNYNQDHFKLGGSMQPGGDIVQERQKRQLTQQEKSSEAGPKTPDDTTQPRRQTPDARPQAQTGD
jgi:hypothetical protein